MNADVTPALLRVVVQRIAGSSAKPSPSVVVTRMRMPGRARQCGASRIRVDSIFTQGGLVISRKVFVGNLSFDTTRVELEQHFSKAGEITDVVIPNDRNTGRPRGFAFVEFSSEQEAAEAASQFDGEDLGGRSLRVNMADDRPQRAPSSMPGGFGDSRPPFEKPQGKPKGSRRRIRGRKRSL